MRFKCHLQRFFIFDLKDLILIVRSWYYSSLPTMQSFLLSRAKVGNHQRKNGLKMNTGTSLGGAGIKINFTFLPLSGFLRGSRTNKTQAFSPSFGAFPWWRVQGPANKKPGLMVHPNKHQGLCYNFMTKNSWTFYKYFLKIMNFFLVKISIFTQMLEFENVHFEFQAFLY